jgi:curved DNA-binding protein CbpA
MAEKNYYIILEVSSTATPEEIKTAYRRLAKKYHPDKNTGNKAAEEYFKEIQEAYAVLSNPEKRKKFDQRFFRTASSPQPQTRTHSGPVYSGNAYQYAQQQAQAQAKAQARQRAAAAYAREKEEASKPPGPNESWQILVSVGIAMVLLYFIISYSSESTAVAVQETVPVAAEIRSPEPAGTPVSTNLASAYTTFFGGDVIDSASWNNLTIYNSDLSDAIVCLVDAGRHRTIRSQYIHAGEAYKLRNIPDGSYSLKVYFGNEWDPQRTFLNGSVTGGFKKERGFVAFDTGKEMLKMKNGRTASPDLYSSLEARITPNDPGKNEMSAEEFFGK